MHPKKLKKLKEKKLAQKTIEELFQRAEHDAKRANEHVRKARNLMMKYKIRPARALKRKFCKHCYAFLKPGVTVRIRTRPGHVVYFCLACKKFMRFPFSKRKVTSADSGTR